MKPARFRYHDPRSLDEALALRSGIEGSTVLAGGQSLLPLMNFRTVRCDDLIDLGRVPDLGTISVEGANLTVGAMARQRSCELSPVVGRACPLMVEALTHVGFVQTRTRGTVCGSLAHLDPAAELVAVANAMDATLEIASTTGTRHVPFGAFARSGFDPDLQGDELLVAAHFPLWPEGHGYAFEEAAPRQAGPTIVGVAVLVMLDADARVTRAAVALAGLDDRPTRGRAVEQFIIGEKLSEETIRAAASLVADHPAVDGIHAPARVRRHLAIVSTQRALRTAGRRAKGARDE